MSKQTVKHGSQIDVATPGEIAALIAEAFSHQGVEEYRRLKGTIALGATGAGQTAAADNFIPADYDILLERVSIGGNGAANALVLVYENDVNSDTNLLEVIQLGATGKYSDSFANTIYVTANSAIILLASGGVASGQITYNMQGKLRRRT